MHTVVKWMVALGLIGVGAATMAQTTYNVDFTASPSERIVGSITVAANSSGQLLASEITAFTFSSVAGDAVAFSTSGTGANVSCAFLGCALTASASALTTFNIPQGGSFPLGTFMSFGRPDLPGGELAFSYGTFVSFNHGPPPKGLDLYLPTGGLPTPINFGLDVGTTIATAAPEIEAASAASGLALLFGGLAVLRGRRKIVASTS
jgi:hypothetical protein